MKADESLDPWASCTWEGAELAQLRREAAQPLYDHLVWLEEMTEFAEKLSKAPALKGPFAKEQAQSALKTVQAK